jgi:hypothetical protein
MKKNSFSYYRAVSELRLRPNGPAGTTYFIFILAKPRLQRHELDRAQADPAWHTR